MSLFAASSATALADHTLKVDSFLRPADDVLSMCQVAGSDYVLTGDSRGFVSAWDVGSGSRSNDDAEQAFEAHQGRVHAITLLRSSRIPTVLEVVEDLEKDNDEDDEDLQNIVYDLSLQERAEPEIMEGGDEDGEDGEEWDPNKARGRCVPSLPGGGGLLSACCRAILPKRRCCGKPRRRKDDQHWFFATAGEDGSVRIWRWRLIPSSQRQARKKKAEGEKKKKKKKEEDPPFEVEIITEWLSKDEVAVVHCLEMHDGHLAIVCANCADILLIDPVTRATSWVLYGHLRAVSAMVECSDGRIASGGLDGVVRLWAQRPWKQDKAIEDRERENAVVAWPEEDEEQAGAGISSSVFFAHTQQTQKGECVPVRVRILVQRAERIPKKDLLSESDPYVTCVAVEGEPGVETARTTAKMSSGPKWDQKLQLTLRHRMINGNWQLPEAAWLSFEVWSGSRMTKNYLVGQYTISVDDVLAEIRRAQPGAQPRMLIAPVGKGPWEELKDARLFVSFEQSSDNTIDCVVESAEGLPIAMTQSAFVRATLKCNTSQAGRVRRMVGQSSQKTKTVDNCADPIFHDVMEVEVPAFHTESDTVYPPNLFLHFEVFDSETLLKDVLLGTVTLPLSKVLESVGVGDVAWGVEAYDMELAAGLKRKKQSDAPCLHLGFQVLTPCPIQLSCTVERALALPVDSGRNGSPGVRMRLVEGDPALPEMTAVRTSPGTPTPRGPVWNERCVLPLPCWLMEPVQRWLRPASVRAGWEHTSQGAERVVCVDIYDADRAIDNLLGRTVVPLEKAIQLAMDARQRGPSEIPPFDVLWSPVGFKDTPKLKLAFELGASGEELVVIVDSAERLVPASSPECLVRICELGAFGEPTDRAKLGGIPGAATPAAVINEYSSRGNPVWNHKEIMELPGGVRVPEVIVNGADDGDGFDEEKINGRYLLQDTQDGALRYELNGPSKAAIFFSGEEGIWKLQGRNHAANDYFLCKGERHHPPGGRWCHVDDEDYKVFVTVPGVAVLPGWHLELEVFDQDQFNMEEYTLARAYIPITDVLSELAALEGPGAIVMPDSLKSRLETMSTTASPLATQTAEGGPVLTKFGTKARPKKKLKTITREIRLTRSGEGPRRAEADVPPAGERRPSQSVGRPSLGGRRPSLAGGGTGMGSLLRRPSQALLRRSPSQGGEGPDGGEGPRRAEAEAAPGGGTGMEIAPTQARLPGTGMEIAPFIPHDAQTSALRTKASVTTMKITTLGLLTYGDEVEKWAADLDDMQLIVKFEAVSRWAGGRRGAQCPPPKAMTHASPVTSLLALASSVVAGHENGSVFVWDTRGSTALPLHKFEAHSVPVSTLTYLPQLDSIVSTGTVLKREDAQSHSLMRVWNCGTFELRQTVSLHGASTRCIQSMASEKRGAPCLVLGTDTQQSTLLQLLKVEKPR